MPYAQDIGLKFLDSLSDNTIQSLYKEQPATISNDSVGTKKHSSFNGYPYAFYTPETQFAVGAGGIFVFYTGEEEDLLPSKVGFGVYYSTNNQYEIGINNTYYFRNSELYFNWPINFGSFVNKYWGIGDDTEDNPDASFSMNTFNTTLTFQIPPKFFSADRSGIILDYDYTEITDTMDNELLLDEFLTGVNGGNLFGLGGDLVWDSRDNIFFPNSGWYQYFKILYYFGGWSDYTYGSFELDVRRYFAFAEDRILAVQLYTSGATGDTPFYKLPALGGSSRMRGFFNGRYRDDFYMMAQVEYRQYFWRRLGYVVFGGLGNMANDITSYNFNNLKYSIGGGLRLLFNKKEKINLRMDIGFGNDGNTGIYFGIEEAF